MKPKPIHFENNLAATNIELAFPRTMPQVETFKHLFSSRHSRFAVKKITLKQRNARSHQSSETESPRPKHTETELQGLKCRGEGLGFRVYVLLSSTFLGFRVSGFASRVSGAGFGVSGLGSGV